MLKNALDPKVPDSLTSDLVHLFRTITSNIRNGPQRLEFLKQLQREKMKSDKELQELCSDDVLPDLEGKYNHSVALTVIKDVITRWNSMHLLHVGAMHDTGTIHKRGMQGI